MSRRSRVWWLLLLLGTAWSCGQDEDDDAEESTSADEEDEEDEADRVFVGVPGSAIRVSEPEQGVNADSDYFLRIFTTEDDCRSAGIPHVDWDRCLPYVDRASGEVHLGFRFEYDTTETLYSMPDISERLSVFHQGTGVEDGQLGRRVEIVPHDPEEARNLFILLIDGSSSMSEVDPGDERTRLEKVKDALIQPDVVETFFPEDGAWAKIVLLQFSKRNGESRVLPVGDELEVLRDEQSYIDAVESMQNLGGYTPLFEAIEQTLRDLPREDVIQDALTQDSAITLIALSDGFNNVAQSDSCLTNVDPLRQILIDIEDIRADTRDTPNLQPTVHTVGLGQPLHGGFNRAAVLASDEYGEGVRPGGDASETSAIDAIDLETRDSWNRWLCGENYQEFTESETRTSCTRGGRCVASRQPHREPVGNELIIDGGMETRGIDNVSMALIADAGGGDSYVSDSADGLADAFRRAAAVRYSWFEVRYDHDPFYMRRSFKTTLQLDGRTVVQSWVHIAPGSWFDGPPGEEASDGWTRPRGFIYSLLVFVPVLSVFLMLSYWGVVSLNLRRAVWGRIRSHRSSNARKTTESNPTVPPPPPPPRV